jgi:hypothetical protein
MVLPPQRRCPEKRGMLMSSSALGVGGWFEGGGCDYLLDVGEELSRDVALEAADDLVFGASFGGAAGDVVLGGLESCAR